MNPFDNTFNPVASLPNFSGGGAISNAHQDIFQEFSDGVFEGGLIKNGLNTVELVTIGLVIISVFYLAKK